MGTEPLMGRLERRLVPQCTRSVLESEQWDESVRSNSHSSESHHMHTRVNSNLYKRLFLFVAVLSLIANLPIEIFSARMDFSVFRVAAGIVREGHRHSLYDKSLQLQNGAPGHFYHLPYEVLLFLPFSWLSFKAGFWAWNAFQCVLVLISTKYLRSSLAPLSHWPLGLLAISFFPVASMIDWGQDSGLLLLVFAVSFRHFIKRKDLQSGAILALGLFKFQYVLPAIAYLVCRKHWNVLKGFAMGAVFILLLSWLMVGSEGMLGYLNILKWHGVEDFSRMPNLRGVLQSLGASSTLVVIVSGFVFLLVAFVPCQREQQFGAAIVVGLLLSYHGHINDSVLLLIPVLLALKSAQAAVDVWPVVFFFSPLQILLGIFHLWPALSCLYLALAGTLLAQSRRKRRSSSLTSSAMPPQ
jgi:glycosyl transferase family 87